MSDVRGVMLFSAEALVQNMSITGAAIETNHSLRVGETVTFKADSTSGKIQMPATVVWCRLVRTRKDARGDSEPVYSAGVEFSNVFTQEAKSLLTLLRGQQVITVETRVTGRFRLELAERVLLDREHELTVQQVSAQGMLIETDLSPALGSAFEMRIDFGTPFEAQGRVMHLQDKTPAGGPPCYRLGIEFVDLRPESRSALTEFLGGLPSEIDQGTAF